MTIREIAELAGVSIGTVDRVVHDRGGVGEQTARRIRRIIVENGYRANGYARNLKLGRKLRVGVLLPELVSEVSYWKLVERGMRKAEAELHPFGVSLVLRQFGRERKGSLSKQVAQLVEERCDVLLLAPLQAGELSCLASIPHEIPVAFIDSSYPAYTPLCTIAQNPFKGGFSAGRVSSLLADGPGTFFCMQIHPDAFNSYERARGFRTYLQQDSANTVIDLTVGDVGDIARCLDEALPLHADVRGIFTVNCIVNHVGSYLASHRLKERIVAVGYDLVPENRAGLLDGTIDCIISQRPVYQGYTAINRLYRLLVMDQKQEGHTEIPIDIYFKENLIETPE